MTLSLGVNVRVDWVAEKLDEFGMMNAEYFANHRSSFIIVFPLRPAVGSTKICSVRKKL
jgi:hypothetical protein